MRLVRQVCSFVAAPYTSYVCVSHYAMLLLPAACLHCDVLSTAPYACVFTNRLTICSSFVCCFCLFARAPSNECDLHGAIWAAYTIHTRCTICPMPRSMCTLFIWIELEWEKHISIKYWNLYLHLNNYPFRPRCWRYRSYWRWWRRHRVLWRKRASRASVCVCVSVRFDRKPIPHPIVFACLSNKLFERA